MRIKKRIKNALAQVLQPYGFSVDGIKPSGYLSKQDLTYQTQGFTNLRDYFQEKWQSDVQIRCHRYVDHFFKHRLQGNEQILEIGTGVGFLTHSLFEMFPQLKYVSFEMDKRLEKYLNRTFKNHQFTSYPCSGNSLAPIDDKTMDVIVVFGVFTYLSFSNMMQYLHEIARTLKQGGWLFFDIFDTDNLSEPLCKAFEQHAIKGDNRPYVSGKLLTGILANKGFELAESFQETSETNYYSNKMLFKKLA